MNTARNLRVLRFQKLLQKRKSCDTFRHFHFQSEEHALGLISRVDLLSKCCCVKLFFHFNVKLLLHTLQTDPVAGPLTRQCGPASGSGVQAIQSDWFADVIGEQILFSLMYWGTSCYN